MKRSSGVLMHVSTLWGEHSEGSFGKAAKEWIDFLCDCGFSYWQTLPFCLPDQYNSPYCSLSTFSVNPYFIDLPTLQKEGLLTKAEVDKAVECFLQSDMIKDCRPTLKVSIKNKMNKI